jgi:hypothetical protein
MNLGEIIEHPKHGAGRIVLCNDKVIGVQFSSSGAGRVNYFPSVLEKELRERLSLIERQKLEGFIEYINSPDREKIPYEPSRNPEAHQFLMKYCEKCFADGTGWIEAHSPLRDSRMASDISRLAQISLEESEFYITYGENSENPTYNLQLPNPNRLGLDDDLVTNLNHRHGIARIQIAKQSLVRYLISLGYLPINPNRR